MFYFTKIVFNNVSTNNIENAIRRFASKRHASLDLASSSSYIKEDKYFLGHEGKNSLTITRIRTPFERFFPKLIVSISKAKQFDVLQVRYSLLSTIVFGILSVSVLQSIYTLIADKEFENDFAPLTIFFIIFLCLTIIEIKLTRRKIQKAIDDYARIDIIEKS